MNPLILQTFHYYNAFEYQISINLSDSCQTPKTYPSFTVKLFILICWFTYSLLWHQYSQLPLYLSPDQTFSWRYSLIDILLLNASNKVECKFGRIKAGTITKNIFLPKLPKESVTLSYLNSFNLQNLHLKFDLEFTFLLDAFWGQRLNFKYFASHSLYCSAFSILCVITSC